MNPSELLGPTPQQLVFLSGAFQHAEGRPCRLGQSPGIAPRRGPTSNSPINGISGKPAKSVNTPTADAQRSSRANSAK
jgi:hypothetical protein